MQSAQSTTYNQLGADGVFLISLGGFDNISSLGHVLGVLLVGLGRGQRLADLQQRHGALRVADRDQAAVARRHRDRGQGRVAHFVRVGDLVLAVEVVPDVHGAVHARDVEDARARRRPAARGQVGRVVLGGHDGRLEVLHPDPGCPVTHSQDCQEDYLCQDHRSIILLYSGIISKFRSELASQQVTIKEKCEEN